GVKAVGVGDCCGVVDRCCSAQRDGMLPDGILPIRAGGHLGWFSSGQPIVATIALKPTSSITIPGRSVNLANEPVEVITKGRHDPCVGIRAVPIAEAMVAIVLLDHLLRHKAQNR
ncbi:chorismate synthase, partial [Pasteurella multocida]|uniref:chorismate synthase n=1 Tax=Pasteurella multocida TaxID=747 RepID=UPI002B6DCDD8